MTIRAFLFTGPCDGMTVNLKKAFELIEITTEDNPYVIRTYKAKLHNKLCGIESVIYEYVREEIS